MLVALAALVAYLGPAETARAELSPPVLVSGTQLVEFEEAGTPELSRDGRYVVFRGTLAGRTGIYRRDLATGAIDVVSEAADAAAPSVSTDGRYVAFTSSVVPPTLAKEDTGSGCPQVFVRDMDRPSLEEPGAFILASADNGREAGLSYATSCDASSAGFPHAGSQAAAGVAMSADGSRVVFTVLSPSNLATGGPCTPAEPAACTSPSQVAVRDLRAHTTTILTTTPSGSPTPGGGAYPSADSERYLAATVESPSPVEARTASYAAISGDGSTVAWLATNIPAQVPAATDVVAGMEPFLTLFPERASDPGGAEVEPLWRRVEPAAGSTPRRLLAGAGLNFYFDSFQRQAEPERPPPVLSGALVGALAAPALSEDGDTALLLSNAPTPTNEPTYEKSRLEHEIPPNDLYLVSLAGPSGEQRQVTLLTATPSFLNANAMLDGVEQAALSPDGNRVALDTARTSFALSPPILISPPEPEIQHLERAFMIDVSLGTVQRVASTFDGRPPDGSAGALSFSGDGRTLAFASSASNIVYGDTRYLGSSEVYLTHDTGPPAAVPPASIEPVPASPSPPTSWALFASASRRADGSAVVDVQVPGAGHLAIAASGQIAERVPHGTRAARRRRARAAHDQRTLAGASRRTPAIAPDRTLARVAVEAHEPGELDVTIRPAARYRALERGRGGLYALLRLSFLAPGRPALEQELPVLFRQTVHPRRSRRARAAR